MREFFDAVVSLGLESQFHPHPFDSATANRICEHRELDWYAGAFVRVQDSWSMVGYVMLRGWDEGYSIPSFGICVLPDYQGIGLGRVLMKAAILVARLRQSPSIRLKVYPENVHAIALYESEGFLFADKLEQDQIVGILELRRKIREEESGSNGQEIS